jgi:hypothetical protein
MWEDGRSEDCVIRFSEVEESVGDIENAYE